MTASPSTSPNAQHARKSPSRRRGLLVGGAAAVALAAAGVGLALTAHKTITLQLDGQTSTVTTFAGSVEGALASAGVEVAQHDLVVPALTAGVADGSVISIKRAQPLHVGGRQVWSARDSLAAAAAESGLGTFSATRSTSRDAVRPLPFVGQGTVVTVVADGKEAQVTATGEMDMTQVLAAAGVQLSAIDQALAEVDDAGGVRVTVVRVVRALTEETAEIPFEQVEQEDEEMEEGSTEVVQEGVAGLHTKRTYTETRDGKATVSVVVSDAVSRAPVAEITAVGTKKKQEEEPEKPSEPAGGGGGGAPVEGVWAALAQCESGGDPTTNTGNGYYGLYQFSLPTWQAMGGSGLPSEASAEEQTMRAQMLQARAGWGQWPACAASLGLL
ncbi:resuscitation-promoting factor [Buchananella hordeovulneris]|uniref:resuscitation-promoting factor n=1 Tax=Buchananella hordeovulneris TaxID=52770 RepID=UPI000F6016C6|nr:resuscitation-promoting factor [Buchananella hordeovulneris]RRD50134.1 resuscitation-promoting factor [Buchananella hordeovulneris]